MTIRWNLLHDVLVSPGGDEGYDVEDQCIDLDRWPREFPVDEWDARGR